MSKRTTDLVAEPGERVEVCGACTDYWGGAVVVAVDRHRRIGGIVSTVYWVMRNGESDKERVLESYIRKPQAAPEQGETQ